MEQQGKLFNEVETLREFTHLDGNVSAGGGCEAAVIAGARCGWAKSMECSELLCCRRFPLRLKGSVNGSYVRPAILHGSEAWFLRESETGILRRAERSMVGAMSGVQLKDGKRFTYVMFMLGLCETIDQLAMANSVRWCGHVLRREDILVLRALDFKAYGQRKKGSLKRTWKKQVQEESVKIGLRREDALFRLKWSVGVYQIAAVLRRIWRPTLVGDTRF